MAAEGDDLAVDNPDAVFSAASTLVGAEEEVAAETQEAIVGTVFPETSGYAKFLVNNLWLLIAAALVFIMHMGFATLESGLTQQKNTVNILFKNVFIISIGVLTYAFTGFNTHYPGDFNGWVKIGGWMGIGSDTLIANETSNYAAYTWYTDFIFQAMFAATAATIVSGAVAERVKLTSFMVFSVILVGLAYPIVGSWHWGGGWLSGVGDGFYDFAGSTVVHAFGGFAALGAVLVLGPRKGKYTSSGIKPILGHSMPLATIGVFMLFLGWFGFNGGSVLSADAHLVSLVFVTTTLSAVSGAIGSIITAWIFLRKPDLSMALNGLLAGLVAITAGADIISPGLSCVAGFIGGIIVVFSILLLDRLRIDDPVGAISVHGTVGIWGTLACAIFGGKSLVTQLTGIAAVCLTAFIFSFVCFTIIKIVMGVRVDEETEEAGLDVEEHGAPAYTI
ncbi:MAG: ammonium transporter [Verrucomicrobiota bacterium]